MPTTNDYRGIPTTVCPCGGRMFNLHVVFDDTDYTVGMYLLDMTCVSCGAQLTAPTEIDHPDYGE